MYRMKINMFLSKISHNVAKWFYGSCYSKNDLTICEKSGIVAILYSYTVAALGFSFNGFQMPNQTIYCKIKVFLQNVCYVFFTVAHKNDVLERAVGTRYFQASPL